MLKNSLKILDTTKTHFRAEVLPEQQKNLIKLLSCRFQQYLGPFNMLNVLVCTQT